MQSKAMDQHNLQTPETSTFSTNTLSANMVSDDQFGTTLANTNRHHHTDTTEHSPTNNHNLMPYGVITGTVIDVLESTEWRRYWYRGQKHCRIIKQYVKGRVTGSTNNKSVKRADSPYLVAFLMVYLNIDIGTALKVTTVMNSITTKATVDDTIADFRYEPIEPGVMVLKKVSHAYKCLPSSVQSLLFEQVNVNDETVGIIFRRDLDSALRDAMIHFISNTSKEYTMYDDKPVVSISTEGFYKMSLAGMSLVMRNMLYFGNDTVHILLHTKQEIGQFGRQYNTLNEFTRADRSHIELYGYDFEAALQNILYHTLISDKGLAPITLNYIENKHTVRANVKQLTGWSKDDTKIELTALYQGRNYRTKYKAIKSYFDEMEVLRIDIMTNLLGDGSTADKYAQKRAEDKMKSKLKDKYNYRKHKANKYQKMNKREKRWMANSYLFFRWTFIERQAQDILASHFENAVTLHDAVYTQDLQDFLKVDIDAVAKEIFEATGVPLNMSKDISAVGQITIEKGSK